VKFGGLQVMWLIVMFDLPTDTKKARKEYTRFRKFLLNDGFTMMQYSIYMRHSSSSENAVVHAKRVKQHLPDDGEVRIIRITDQQFGKIEVFYGKKRQKATEAPLQLQFF
jgi:CRISPR-associated protein Cas2